MDPELAKAIASFFGAIGVILASGLKGIEIYNARKMRRIAKIPGDTPEVCPVPDRPPEDTAMALIRRIGDLEQMVFDLRSRIARVDADRADLASDLSRTAAALNASQQREEALNDELIELRDALDSSHTRLPLPPSRAGLPPVSWPPVITETSAEDTPPQGTRRPRR